MDFSTLKRFTESETTASDCYGYLDCDVIAIEKYTPSRLETKKVIIAQDEMPGGGTVILFEKEYYGTLALRIPKELIDSTHILIDGDEYTYAVSGVWDEPRYALIAGPFESGCRIKLTVTGPKKDAPEPAPVVAASEPAPASEVADFAPLSETATKIPSSEEPKHEGGVTPASFVNPTLIVRDLTSDNGVITYKEEFARYLVSMDTEASFVALSVPSGYTIEADGTELISDKGIRLAVSSSLFTGYPIRIYTPGRASYRDYDLVIMRSYRLADTSVCAVHAYTKVTGAFSGEACYIIDNCGSITESPTHGSVPIGSCRIDPLTGYKWGITSPDKYSFELENGGYEIIATFGAKGARLIAYEGSDNEKVLIRESNGEEQHAGVRVTDGILKLSIIPADAETGDTMLITLIIRALDTVAVDSGYKPLKGEERSSEPQKFTFENFRPEPYKPETDTPYTKTYPSSVKKHVDATLAAKKSRETAKTVGIAAGALALAGSIIALLSKDKD